MLKTILKLFNTSNPDQPTHGTGAIADTRAPEEKAKDFVFAEIVASATPVKWVKKTQPKGLQFEFNEKTWRRFPVRNQDGSSSCVAQTMAKLMGILGYLRFGIFIVLSAGHIYIRRINKAWGNGEGMGADDVFKIAQEGVTLEEFMPSMNLSEKQINSLYENDLHKSVGLKIKNWIALPIGDLETVASVIQTTKKGVMTWVRFDNREWKAVPKILYTLAPAHHSIASVDATLWDEEKALVIDENWGNTEGFEGQRVITESFYKTRNTYAAYPIDLKFETEIVPEPKKNTFARELVFIELDPVTHEILPVYKPINETQKADVIALQDILKKEGIFPSNVSSTGLYHNLTRKAVLAFQTKYKIASEKELADVNGKRVGSKTLAKLNELYGK